MKGPARACVWIPLTFLWVLGAIDPGGGALGEAPDLVSVREFTLNALDYRRSIYDFHREALGTSRQLDEKVREYFGDIIFNGRELTVLENERTTGTFLALGRERKPDDEFSWFYSLRLYKRIFQARRFPFEDRYEPCQEIDSRSFFTTRDPVTSAEVGLAHLYALRLHHRTKVGDERVFLLRVIEFVPGSKVTVLWRELEIREED